MNSDQVPEAGPGAADLGALLVHELRQSWSNGQQPDIVEFLAGRGPFSAAQLAVLLRLDQQQRWSIGERISAESYLQRFPTLAQDSDCVLDVIYAEYLVREALDEQPSADEYADRFPQFATQLRQQIAFHSALQGGTLQGADSQADEERPADDAGNATARQQSTIGHHGRTAEPSGCSAPAAPHGGDGDGDGPTPQFPGYEIVTELGRGGMAVVYQARHKNLDRMVALKVLSTHLRSTPQALQRLRNEATAIARLQHPNIVQVYEVGEHHGTVYLSLELVQGGSLAERFRGTPLPPRQTAELLEQLARAVQHAHQQGVIHRDLKPGNVLLQIRPENALPYNAPYNAPHKSPHVSAQTDGTTERRPKVWQPVASSASFLAKISDFGLAKIRQVADADHCDATREGDVLGTPSYMAPEQARGEPGAASPAADVYALGAILYELLTGRPPYQGVSAVDILQQVLHQDPIRPSRLLVGVPRELETICLKCLDKEPSKRYATAEALADDLARYLAGKPILARRARLPERCWKWAGRHKTETALTALVAVLLGGLASGFFWHRQQQQQTQVAALVDALLVAEPAAVPRIVDRLADHPRTSQRTLEVAFWTTPLTPRARLHLRIAQLRGQPQWAVELADYARRAQPDEIGLLSTALRSHGKKVSKPLWQVVTDPDALPRERLAAACILAGNSPDDARWQQVASVLVAQLVSENPLHAGLWSETLLPIHQQLTPALVSVFRDQQATPSHRLVAASILVEYSDDQPELLTQLLLESTPAQYAILLPSIQRSAEAAWTTLEPAAKGSWNEPIPDGLDGNSPEALAFIQGRVSQAHRRAIAAIALAHLGRDEPLRQLLRLAPDPTARTLAIERAGTSGLPVRWFLDCLAHSTDVSVQRACVLALGRYDPAALRRSEREELPSRLRELFATHADPGLHGAIAWLARTWQKQSLLRPTQAGLLVTSGGELGWYTNGEGQTFAILPAGEFTMGSPASEEDHESDEVLHGHRIERPIAVAMREVTVAEYLRFRPDAPVNTKYNPDADGPMGNLSWFDAAAYCRWLSEREGIAEQQMCFPPLDQIKPGMTLPADYLQRHGYRLPAEPEWEYACRAGTSSGWSFGIASELVVNFGQCLFNSRNRAWPTGTLQPNDFGLSDMHGNVQEWCVERLTDDPSMDEDLARQSIVDLTPRRTRGGSFGDVPLSMRSARRSAHAPDTQWSIIGLRPVRTMPAPP